MYVILKEIINFFFLNKISPPPPLIHKYKVFCPLRHSSIIPLPNIYYKTSFRES